MISALLLLLLILFLPILLFLLFYTVVSISFVKLGIPKPLVFILFLAILVGGLINIPVWESQSVEPGGFFRSGHIIFFRSPHIRSVIVAINVGGALIPLLVSLYLLTRAPLLKTVVATGLVAAVAFWFAQVVPGEGITMNPLVAPLVSAGVAMILAWRESAPVAYIAGTVGTLVGADLLHLGEVISAGGTFLSIGGAGVLDGIFLVGVIAAFLSPGTGRKKEAKVT